MKGFKDKLRYSKKLIQEALTKFNKPIVACSFGKDSIVVLHLVRQYTRQIKVLWNNTLVEYPDTCIFARRIIEEWHLDCIEARPKVTFWDIVKEHGFPIHSRNSQGDKQCAARICCDELKKKPTKSALRKVDCDVYFTGLTRFESRLREFSARKYGDFFYSKKWDHWKCHPLLNWTSEDVWEYINHYKVPYNPLYDKKGVQIDGGIRTGCWPCTQAVKYGKLHHLREYYPKLFKLLVIEKNLGDKIMDLRIESYKNIKSRVADYLRNSTYRQFGAERALDVHPCFFDRL